MPIEARSPVKIIENRTLSHVLSNNGLCFAVWLVHAAIFSIGNNSDQFQILRSYTLLLQLLVLMHIFVSIQNCRIHVSIYMDMQCTH